MPSQTDSENQARARGFQLSGAASLLVTLLWRIREKSLAQLGEKLLLHFAQTLHPCRAAKPDLKNQANKKEKSKLLDGKTALLLHKTKTNTR